MRNPLGFFVELLRQPVWIPIWVFALMVVNIASTGFWDEPLARLIFGTFMVSAVLMMGLYSLFGLEKILGLAHVLWIPLLVYVLVQIPGAEGTFGSYLIVLPLFLAISLVFDVIDVWKYFASRRTA